LTRDGEELTSEVRFLLRLRDPKVLSCRPLEGVRSRVNAEGVSSVPDFAQLTGDCVGVTARMVSRRWCTEPAASIGPAWQRGMTSKRRAGGAVRVGYGRVLDRAGW